MAKTILEPSRKSRKGKVHPVVIIVCEAEKTEPIYFSHFKKRDKPLRIEIVKGVEGIGYHALIKKAVDAKIKYVDGTKSTWDIWCVSDVDVDRNTPSNQSIRNRQLKDYAKEARKNGIKIALSNPCFELWFLLHFIYTSGYMPDYDAVAKELVEYLPHYQKNCDVYGLLEDKQATAVSHAKMLKLYHEGQGKADYMDVSLNPYTNVWQLVSSLSDMG